MIAENGLLLKVFDKRRKDNKNDCKLSVLSVLAVLKGIGSGSGRLHRLKYGL
jgi:hypothetical protein